MGELISTVLTIGGLAVLIPLYIYLSREEKRIWSSGTEGERFEERIDTITAHWVATEVEPSLRRELKEDLEAFCADAMRSEATTMEVFGNDVGAFADLWVSEHRHPPNPLLIAILRFAVFGSLFMAFRSGLQVYRSLRGTTTDETFLFTLILCIALGLVAGSGSIITMLTGRNFWVNGFGLQGVLGFTLAALSGMSILFGTLFLTHQVLRTFFGISLAPADDEFTPTLWPWLVCLLVSFPMCLRFQFRLDAENNKRIDSLFGDAEGQEIGPDS